MKSEIRALKILFFTIILGIVGILYYFHNPRLIDGYLAGKIRNDEVKRWGADYLYPNPKLTPGKADTLNREDLIKKYPCKKNDFNINEKYVRAIKSRTKLEFETRFNCSYSKYHRKVSNVDKMQVYIRYGINPKKVKRGEYEIDHFQPLCAGGSNDKSNLWAQPRINKYKRVNYGFAEKDLLEKYVCDKIKKGKLEPKEAYNKIMTDWVKYYLEYSPLFEKNLGGNTNNLVGDDYEL